MLSFHAHSETLQGIRYVVLVHLHTYYYDYFNIYILPCYYSYTDKVYGIVAAGCTWAAITVAEKQTSWSFFTLLSQNVILGAQEELLLYHQLLINKYTRPNIWLCFSQNGKKEKKSTLPHTDSQDFSLTFI